MPAVTAGDSAGVVARQEGHLLRVELARPEKLNALTPEMGQALLDTIRVGAADPLVRGILLSGQGRGFCSGVDISGPATVDSNGIVDASHHLETIYHPLILALREAPKPIVAAVRGPVVGIGAALALACDLVVMAETSYILVPFVRIGLGLDGGLAALVTDRVGLTRAAELFMLGEPLASSKALEWGLVNKVVPDEQLESVADSMSTSLSEGPTVALASIKRALGEASIPDFREHLDLEARLQKVAGETDDYRTGRDAFRDRSNAHFIGR